MKNIFLTMVIVCALAIAGIGGTLANFSDTEEVFDNTFESGSLDLLVWDEAEGGWVNEPPYGVGATGLIDVTCAAPEGQYATIIYVANFGDCVSGDLFMRFKELRCYNIDEWQHDETGIWMEDPDLAAPLWRLKPEPELVAEYGGFIDQWEYVTEGKVEGDNCSWEKILEAKVKFDGTTVQQWKLLDQLIIDAEENGIWIECGELESCGGTHEVEIFLRYKDQEHEGWANMPYDPMFKDWPTNRYMLDGAKFNIMFGLVQPV